MTYWNWPAGGQAPAEIPFWTRDDSHKSEGVTLTSRIRFSHYRQVIHHQFTCSDKWWIVNCALTLLWITTDITRATVLVKCTLPLWLPVNHKNLIRQYLQGYHGKCYKLLLGVKREIRVMSKLCQYKCQRKPGKQKKTKLWMTFHGSTKDKKGSFADGWERSLRGEEICLRIKIGNSINHNGFEHN